MAQLAYSSEDILANRYCRLNGVTPATVNVWSGGHFVPSTRPILSDLRSPTLQFTHQSANIRPLCEPLNRQPFRLLVRPPSSQGCYESVVNVGLNLPYWHIPKRVFYRPQLTSPFALYAYPRQTQVLRPSSLELEPEEWMKLSPNINPTKLDLGLMRNGRYFVIKSNSSHNIVQSLRYGCWCSTPVGNDLLHTAYCKMNNSNPQLSGSIDRGHVLLFFSITSSGCFCGLAEMTSSVDKQKRLSIWQNPGWRGVFAVRWIYVKDVPNRLLRHIQVASLENRAVTNLRDSNEVLPPSKGEEMLRIMHNY